MPDQTVGIRLTADGSGFVGELKLAEGQLDRLAAATGRTSSATDRQTSAGRRMTRGMSATTIATRRMERGMSSAGRAALQQATAARTATAANRGLAGSFRAAHGSAAKYVLGVGAAAVVTGEIYAQLRRVPGALRETFDGYTELNNRLRLVTQSEGQLIAVRRRLLALSQDSDTALNNNALLYNRLTLASSNTGHSQAQLLRVTEILNKQVAIGGDSAESAAAGLNQLAQGLASGRFQGDELRSVLEGLLGVSQGLIDGFALLRERGQIDIDITRENIRELAAEGVLTSKLILDAVIASADITEQRFERVEKTLSSSFVRLGNSITFALGKLNARARIGSDLPN